MNKKRKIAATALLLCGLLLTSACGQNDPNTTDTVASTEGLDSSSDTSGDNGDNTPVDDGFLYGETHIHAISELNLVSEEDDHASSVGSANFELNFREHTEIPRNILTTTNPYYPRVKKVSDDNYLLFYNTGKTDPSCYYSTSKDLKTWEKGQPLFEGTANTHYATCDAVVLDNGTVLAVASFRPTDWGSYTSDMTASGLVIRSSSDGGKTWSEMKKIYTGMNWEPYLLQLESGEVQCYFTHTAPYTHLYGYNTARRSSGVGLIRSHDNGASWTPDVTSAPYSAEVASQTYIGEMGGHKMFTEQMPAVVQLHCGTLLMACETQPNLNDNSVFKLAITRSYDNFKPLDLHTAGPADKDKLTSYHASGPYVAQMLSGESVISFFGSGGFNLIIGGADGKNFAAPTQPLSEHNSSYWASIEVIGSHTLLGACDDDTKTGNVSHRRITLGNMYLNHDLNAKNTAVTLDGKSDEWSDNTDALFVGSQSQAQASVRFASDSDNVYIVIERLDEYLETKGDTVALFLASKSGTDYYKLTVDGKGIASVHVFKNKRPSDFTSSAEASALCVGKVSDASGADTGYIVELKLPASEFGLSLEEGMYVSAVLSNKDQKKTYDNDGITGHDLTDKSTWTYVSVK